MHRYVFEDIMPWKFHQKRKVAGPPTGAFLDVRIAPYPLMTFPTLRRYAVPAPMKEKETPIVTLSSGSDEPTTSPYKYEDPAYLVSPLSASHAAKFATLSPPQASNAIVKRKAPEHRSTSARRNAIPKALLLDSQHQDEIETLDAKVDSKSAKGVLTTFELFPDLAPELRLKIWNLALGGPRSVKIDFKISPRFVPGEHNTRVTRSPKELVIQHFVISSLTVEPLGTYPEIDVLDWLFANSHQVQTVNFPPMNLLRVCQESRHEAILRLPRYLELPFTGERFYFDPEIDSIVFDERAYRAVFNGSTFFGLNRNIKPILGHAKPEGIPRGKVFVSSWGVIEMYQYLTLFRKYPSDPQFAWIKGPPKPTTPLRERLHPKTLLGRVRAFFGSRKG